MRQKSWGIFCQCLSQLPAATQLFLLSEWVAGWPGLLWIYDQTQQKINLGSWLQTNVHALHQKKVALLPLPHWNSRNFGVSSSRTNLFLYRDLLYSLSPSKVVFLQSILIKQFVLLVYFCKISFIEKWKVHWHFLNRKYASPFHYFFPSLSQLPKEHFIESRIQVHLFLHVIPTWSYNLQFVTSHLLPYPPAVRHKEKMRTLGSK